MNENNQYIKFIKFQQEIAYQLETAIETMKHSATRKTSVSSHEAEKNIPLLLKLTNTLKNVHNLEGTVLFAESLESGLLATLESLKIAAANPVTLKLIEETERVTILILSTLAALQATSIIEDKEHHDAYKVLVQLRAVLILVILTLMMYQLSESNIDLVLAIGNVFSIIRETIGAFTGKGNFHKGSHVLTALAALLKSTDFLLNFLNHQTTTHGLSQENDMNNPTLRFLRGSKDLNNLPMSKVSEDFDIHSDNFYIRIPGVENNFTGTLPDYSFHTTTSAPIYNGTTSSPVLPTLFVPISSTSYAPVVTSTSAFVLNIISAACFYIGLKRDHKDHTTHDHV